MPEDRLPLLTEEVVYRRLGEGLGESLGMLELYPESVLIRQRWKRPSESPYFGKVTSGEEGPLESGEMIPFSEIRQISGEVKGRLLKEAVIQLETEVDVVWEIKGSPKIFSSLRDAYDAWKEEA